MEPLLAVVWHFWIGAVLAAAAIGAVILTIFMYFHKVSRTRYEQ